MDILDVSLTMKEFKTDWLLRYTRNDLKFWGPLLESSIPSQQICAEMLIEAWGLDSVFKAYKNWKRIQENKVDIKAERKARLEGERDRRMYYYMSDGVFTMYSNAPLREDEIADMTWSDYFTYWVQREMS